MMCGTECVRCPVCTGNDLYEILRMSDVPVHQNLLFTSASEARLCPRGNYHLCVCSHCGFMFNSAFDESLMAYGADYENSQAGSTTIQTYLAHLLDEVASANTDALRFLEVGCGNGAFIRQLAARLPLTSTAVGLDPSYLGPSTEFDGRLRFERRMVSPKETPMSADVVMARHLIEHIESPIDLLAAMGESVRDRVPGRIYLETPDARWILGNRV